MFKQYINLNWKDAKYSPPPQSCLSSLFLLYSLKFCGLVCGGSKPDIYSTKLTCVKNDISRYVDELLNTAFLRGGHVAQQWQVYCRFRFLKTFFRLITGLSQESVTAEAALSNYSSQHWKIKWPEWNLAVQISYLGWLWQWQTANSSTNPEGFPNRW